MNKKKLIIIATPIGNLNELSYRAIEAIKSNKNFFCEDTRVFKKILYFLQIDQKDKKIHVLNAVNENKTIEKFKFDEQIYCLVSDAGYPTISDPGYSLINHFINKGWQLEVINGPSSVMHALVVSGFKTNQFLFYGFLKHNSLNANKELTQLKEEKKTIILFESVHRIKKTLMSIEKIFGENTKICVCRELTKLNETIYRGKINEILKSIVEKGEFVIVINNTENENKTEYTNYVFEIESLIGKGEKEKIACKIVAYKYNLKSNKLYEFWQRKKNNV